MSLNSRSTWQSGLHASVDAMAEAESGLAQIIVVGEEWTNAGPQNRVAAQPQCLRTANTTRTADALCRARMTPPTRGMLGQPPHRAYHLRLLCRSSSPPSSPSEVFFLSKFRCIFIGSVDRYGRRFASAEGHAPFRRRGRGQHPRNTVLPPAREFAGLTASRDASPLYMPLCGAGTDAECLCACSSRARIAAARRPTLLK